MPGPRRIRAVAQRLGELAGEVVFVGGATVPLLVTDVVAPVFRETRDVDFVVEVASRVTYAAFEARLRSLGFQHDTTPGAPLCRWLAGDVVVDAMPDDPRILGFGNPWYAYALTSSCPFTFAGGETVRLVSAPAFLLTKWEAFQGRGGGTDYYGSQDIEDILTVVDGRSGLTADVAAAPPDARAAIRAAGSRLLADPRFLNALPGLVELGRGVLVEQRLAELAA